MGTFKAYFKKEILESIRQYRYIILVAGVVFFAISDPIMMKLLPEILKNKMKGDMAALFVITPTSVFQSYIKDLFQIGAIIVFFTLCGSLSDEIINEKLVFPYSKGSSPAGIVISKIVHYGIVVSLITTGGFLINHYYISLLIKGEAVPISEVLSAAGVISLYFLFNIILVMFFSAIFKKSLISGFITLGLGYFTALLNNVDSIRAFIPYRLVNHANGVSNDHIMNTIFVVLMYCVILTGFTIYKMNKIEI